MSLCELTVLCCFCAVLELDNVQAGQFMVSRPSVVGTLLGLATGRLLQGMQIGLWTELLFLDRNPMGGSIPPNGLVAAAGGVLILGYSGLEVSIAFVMGIMLGLIYPKVDIWLRNRRSAWNQKIENTLGQKALMSEGRMPLYVMKSLTMECCCCWMFLLLGVVLAGAAGKFFWHISSVQIRSAVDFAYGAVPWLGLAAIVFKFQPGGRKQQYGHIA